jgi:hypothetical protein
MGKTDKKEKKSKSSKRHHSSDDEDTAHRAQKKSHKKAEKIAKVFGYSNDINPFGDSNLLQPFVWGKKQDKEKKEGKVALDPEEERLKLMSDIEKVRKRREDRELEVEEMERLRTEEGRLREAAQYGDWMKKEEDYHMEQTKTRSKIRLMEGREKPVDVLAKNILIIEDYMNRDDKKAMADAVGLARLRQTIKDPVTNLEAGGMSVEDLDQFIADADNYLHLEMRKREKRGPAERRGSAKSDAIEEGDYVTFWQGLKDIAAGQRKAKRLKEQDEGSRSGHKAIQKDVRRVFGGKTAPELEELNKEILAGVQSGSRTDAEYWEAMAAEALLEAARIVVRERYAEILSTQLDILHELKEEIDIENAIQADGSSSGRVMEGSDFRFLGGEGESSSSSAKRNAPNDFLRAGGEGVAGEVDSSEASLAMERSEAAKGELGDAEEKMGATDEISLAIQDYHWQDKYRPRKPRYFNRVRTGYDWNKYNSTHYDSDNPPPKYVIGYKFNLFFPDLIDKATTPQFFIEKCDEAGFAVIRFHAGPPYEDIAFKLVSKQWDTNKRAGFRIVFERGVLQVHFNFKRHWYRR